MERSADENTVSRFRMFLAGSAPGWEVVAVAAVAAVGWLLTLGWDWSSIQTTDPVHTIAPQSDLDWLALGVVVAVGVGWLARRGRAVSGATAIWVPIILLSGWRLAAAGVLGWPISLASLIFVVSAICIVAGGIGAWLRHRAQRSHIEPDDVLADAGDAPESDVVEEPRIPAGSSHR